MDQSMIKTSWRQRIGIIVIALVLLGSTVAVYIAIVLGGNSSTSKSSNSLSDEDIAALEEEYTTKQNQLNEMAQPYSDKYLAELSSYKSRVTAYNTTAANTGGIKTEDLKAGDGRELASGDTQYLAYYIGFCGNEYVFDSSFDNFESPASLKPPIDGDGLISGWTEGVIGMKLGGIREITIPSELGYPGQTVCGDESTDNPLKFVVYALPEEYNAELVNLNAEVINLSYELYYASMGISL
ncbi:FKBP-type peptidyl-prolyl cis-trans isomerase [Candidatus Saccharibacteria bacterium]|nr:FKBP-type peptidyl-prolyl cis-trans isomerase [Candidatus Saccharibacteria bacterium]